MHSPKRAAQMSGSFIHLVRALFIRERQHLSILAQG